MRFCLCIFESDTVKSDCPVQENDKIFKDFIQTVGYLTIVLLFFSGDIKKKKKKSSENDQFTGHFHSFFILFFHPLDPYSEKKNSHKSTNKKILA